MAGHLVGLKLALLRNGLRRSNWPQQARWPSGPWPGCPWPSAGSCCWPWSRGRARGRPAAGRDRVPAPVSRLGAVPAAQLRRRRQPGPVPAGPAAAAARELVTGLSLAACVGGPRCAPWSPSAGPWSGSAPSARDGLVVAAVLAQFALCIVGSRALLTALPASSARAKPATCHPAHLGDRARPQPGPPGGARLAERLERADLEALRPLARALGWLPTGLAARALERRRGAAAARGGRAGRGRPGRGPARLVVVAQP